MKVPLYNFTDHATTIKRKFPKVYEVFHMNSWERISSPAWEQMRIKFKKVKNKLDLEQ